MKHSRFSLIVCALAILYTGLIYYPKWNKPGSEATISWDVSGYYMYLPATFIYKDLKQCSFKDSILSKYQPTPDFQQAFRHTSGNYVMKYPAGQAIVMLPFFVAAHAYASVSAYPADGFSMPYQFAISMGMLLIAFIGLWVLRKILLLYFSDSAAAITLLIVAFASNYLNYAAIDNGMVHNSLFAIYCLLILSSIRFHAQPSIKRAVVIGMLIGLATLIRPTEIIAVILPLLWGVTSVKELQQRFVFFLQNFRLLFVATISTALVLSIQLIYWKYSSGEWVVYSYQDQGFSWLHPHLYGGMFSSNNGWLTYTPVMILFFFGLPLIYKSYRNIFWPILFFSGLFIYICFAWDIWWYGGSMGMRAMIQSYPVLLLAVAACVERFLKAKNSYKFIAVAFLLFCSYYNFWLTHQAHRGGLYRAGEMTDAYLKAIFLKWNADPQAQFLLDRADDAGTNFIVSSEVYSNNFDLENDQYATTNYAINGKSILLGKDRQSTPEYFFNISAEQGDYLRSSASFRSERKEWNTWRMAQFIVKFYKGDAMVDYKMVRVFRVLNDNETRRIYFDAKLPKGVNKASVSFWNAESDHPLLVDDLKVFLLEK
jgi:Dolichyl-phosphate-mannose-protein mannosyltransferase